MKKSEYNLGVLENFILWYTHRNRSEIDSSLTWGNITAKDLYSAADSYIENDDWDGIDGDDEGENAVFTNK